MKTFQFPSWYDCNATGRYLTFLSREVAVLGADKLVCLQFCSFGVTQTLSRLESGFVCPGIGVRSVTSSCKVQGLPSEGDSYVLKLCAVMELEVQCRAHKSLPSGPKSKK
jgi:hypothetical protein